MTSVITCPVDGCNRRPSIDGVREFLLTQTGGGAQLDSPPHVTLVFCEEHAWLFDGGQLRIAQPAHT
jgi:hypothetical protein